MLQLPDAELHAKAVELGIITKDQDLPPSQRSRVAAVLLADRRAAEQPQAPAAPKCAREITVRGSEITVDGKPFPWLVARAPMEIGLNPDGSGTVRITLLADAVQILTPQPTTESE
ncbi:hypothetical protein [Streptomyces longwoodensis]|uniref:hypothetical protein n=1 Tax=Streptomyces longwoodensis TaxID=68231 RepID=UPI00225271FB|nr:hypothetical protein [Streptomyces longwoodensis]MCX4993854.1 hypothetical protein [Streptomyces longwoodensis]MCX4998026.1 hypothetical protein [Streptomyces longwoodensis]